MTIKSLPERIKRYAFYPFPFLFVALNLLPRSDCWSDTFVFHTIQWVLGNQTTGNAPSAQKPQDELDPSTGALVGATSRALILLRHYRKFFPVPDYKLNLEAYISLDDPFGTAAYGCHATADFHQWSLSVDDERALLVGPTPMLFDYSHLPTQPEDIIVTLLDPNLDPQPGERATPGAYQAYEGTCGTIAKGARQAFALRREGSGPWRYDHRKRERTVIEHWDFQAPPALQRLVGGVSTQETPRDHQLVIFCTNTPFWRLYVHTYKSFLFLASVSTLALQRCLFPFLSHWSHSGGNVPWPSLIRTACKPSRAHIKFLLVLSADERPTHNGTHSIASIKHAHG